MSQYQRLFGTCRVPTDVSQLHLRSSSSIFDHCESADPSHSEVAGWRCMKTVVISSSSDEDNSVSVLRSSLFICWTESTRIRLVRLPRLQESTLAQRQGDPLHTRSHRPRRRQDASQRSREKRSGHLDHGNEKNLVTSPRRADLVKQEQQEQLECG